jgi:hypothetical protein
MGSTANDFNNAETVSIFFSENGTPWDYLRKKRESWDFFGRDFYPTLLLRCCPLAAKIQRHA